MRPILIGGIVAVAALLAFPVTAGAGPGGGPTFHDHGTDAGVDPNFCGTGVAVEFAGRFNFVTWLAETGGEVQPIKESFNYSFTLTNPKTGRSIVDSAAGTRENEIIHGLESGPHTHLITEKGLRGKLKLANGRTLLHDSGTITFEISFDADDNVTGIEVLQVHGPHPGFDSDLWCDTATAALGIG
jgi:hypothetical protein